MIAEGLLVEREALLAATGRRPVPLDIDYSSKLSIGLKVMVERVIGVITDLATRVIAETQLPLPDSRPETVVKISARVAERLLSQAKVNRSRVIGIGLTLAGQVDAEEGHLPADAALRLARRADRRDACRRRVGAGLGRQRRQRLRRRRSTFSAMRAGCRASPRSPWDAASARGWWSHGRLYRGGSGAAGEFGHNFDEHGRRCECGRDGCIEAYCSDSGLVEQLERARSDRRSARSADELADAANAGDPIARRVLSEAGTASAGTSPRSSTSSTRR